MEASSEMFLEQSLKFGVLGVEQVGRGQKQLNPPWVGQCGGVVKRFSAILVFKSLWHFK